MEQDLAVVGVSVPRLGLAEKVRGLARYTADLKRSGMLFGRVLRSPHAHARIIHLDTSEAERVPGVHAVLTYQDVPQRRMMRICCPSNPSCALSAMRWPWWRRKARPSLKMRCV